MCFGTNPGCSCCKQLPFWAFSSESSGVYNPGFRHSVNGDVLAASGIGAPLIEAHVLDSDDYYGHFARSYDVVYRYSGTDKIRQYDAKLQTQNWESVSAASAFSTNLWRHMSVGDFGLVLMSSHATSETVSTTYTNTPIALEIDKDGTWIMEPRDVTELVVGGSTITPSTQTQFLITFSSNSKHALVERRASGTLHRVAGAYQFVDLGGGSVRLEIDADLSSSTSSSVAFPRTALIGVDVNGVLYCTGFNDVVTLNAAPGPDMCYVKQSGTTITHGVVSRGGGATEFSFASTSITGAGSSWTARKLCRCRIAGAYACSLEISPANAAIMFPDLDLNSVQLDGGLVNFTQHYLNFSHTRMRRREPYNFGDISVAYSSNNPSGQVLDQDSVAADVGVTLTVEVDHAGDEFVEDLVWLIDTTDALFTLNFDNSGPLANFDVTDLVIHQFRFEWAENWQAGVAVSAHDRRRATGTAGSKYVGQYCWSEGTRTTGASWNTSESSFWTEVNYITHGEGPDPTITWDAENFSQNSDAQYELELTDIDGGRSGGVITVAINGNTDAYNLLNGFPLYKVPGPTSQWYYIPPSEFVCDITRRSDSTDLEGTTAEFDVLFYANPLAVTADDFEAAVTGDVTAGTVSISGSGRNYVVSVATVAGGAGGGTIGLNLAGAHNITSTMAPFTLSVDVDETYNVAAE